MSVHDWLLFLHVLSAFMLVGALVLFSFMIGFLWRSDLPADIARVSGISRVGTIVLGVGSIGVLVLGVILAFEADSYAIWDPWIVAAIVLWAAVAGVGGRAGKAYDAAGARARALLAEGRTEPTVELGTMFRSRSALGLHTAASLLTVLLLLDMIFKPGA